MQALVCGFWQWLCLFLSQFLPIYCIMTQLVC